MELTADLTQVAHHAKHAAKHAAHIKQGFTMTTLLVSSLVTLVLGTVGGWYARGRGLAGVKTDVSNVVTTVEKDAAAAQVPPAA